MDKIRQLDKVLRNRVMIGKMVREKQVSASDLHEASSLAFSSLSSLSPSVSQRTFDTNQTSEILGVGIVRGGGVYGSRSCDDLSTPSTMTKHLRLARLKNHPLHLPSLSSNISSTKQSKQSKESRRRVAMLMAQEGVEEVEWSVVGEVKERLAWLDSYEWLLDTPRGSLSSIQQPPDENNKNLEMDNGDCGNDGNPFVVDGEAMSAIDEKLKLLAL